eukprot:2772934-Amphidinium_carterae.1
MAEWCRAACWRLAGDQHINFSPEVVGQVAFATKVRRTLCGFSALAPNGIQGGGFFAVSP